MDKRQDIVAAEGGLDLGKAADDCASFAGDCQCVERRTFKEPFCLRRKISGNVNLSAETPSKYVALGRVRDRSAGRSDPDAPPGQLALDVGNGLSGGAHDKTHQVRDRSDFACQCAGPFGRGSDTCRSTVELSILCNCQHRWADSVTLGAAQALQPLVRLEAERARLP